MGRARGGLTTKIHALVDATGLPIALKLTAGQARDGRSATDMLGTLGKGDDNFLASVQLASIRIWMRHNESVA